MLIRLVQDFSVNAYGDNLPRNEFSAVLKRSFCGHLKTAAAWNFHSDDGDALNVVALNNRRQLLAIVHLI